MYFIERGKGVCHLLEDTADGRAPCGVRASQLDMIVLWAGRQAPNITTQKPADIPLCEHCAKSESEQHERA
jgi:hypothetical protein